MRVRVDKAGGENFAGKIDNFRIHCIFGFNNNTVGNGNISDGINSANRVDDPGIFQNVFIHFFTHPTR